jgi:hypothetical protein
MTKSSNRLIIVAQEKGGVWKTFLSVHLVSYLRGLGLDICPVDFDLATGHLSRVYPDALSVSADPMSLVNGESNLIDMLRLIMGGKRCVFDCGANTGVTWHSLLDQKGGVWPGFLNELRSSGTKLTVVVPVAKAAYSQTAFEIYRKTFPSATFILVSIRKYKDESFTLPSHPDELTITPPLAPPALISIYEETGLNLEQIRDSRDPALRMAPGFARGYLPELYKTFDKIKDHLT